MEQIDVPNILADRYASKAMLAIWSPKRKVELERKLWVAVMRTQKELGVEIPEDAITDYESVLPNIALDSIRQRETRTRHDVKARIEEFNALAGHEFIHLGMTSRDLTENIEQLQIRLSLELIRDRIIATLARLARHAKSYKDTSMVGRTHNAAAQVTTLGKRFANAAEEQLLAHDRIVAILESYPLHGIKGPVGTQQDLLDLFDGDAQKVATFEKAIASHLGFRKTLTNVGQVYPRSLDVAVVDVLVMAASSPSSFATTLRLMAGRELVTEGFAEGQVGSSAMPHKMNTRSSERVNGLRNVLLGYQTMLSSIAGTQWGEGDVSCSVVRRVALPGAFFTIDGLFETWLTVLDGFGAYPAMIEQELDKYLPFLSTTNLLAAAVQRGLGREEAHEIISKHAVAVALHMRESGSSNNDLFDRLAHDDAFPLTQDEIATTVKDSARLSQTTSDQINALVHRVEKVTQEYPDAATYAPGEIL